MRVIDGPGVWRRGGVCAAVISSALMLGIIPAVSGASDGTAPARAHASQNGYIVTFCRLPSTGMAIRAGDSDSTTELGRVYNGNVGRVYATSAGEPAYSPLATREPSISPGWGTGYGRLNNGLVQHGYFKMYYTCAQ
jgi:hypothetical protein